MADRQTKEARLRCEHDLRVCPDCDPYIYSRMMTERLGQPRRRPPICR